MDFSAFREIDYNMFTKEEEDFYVPVQLGSFNYHKFINVQDVEQATMEDLAEQVKKHGFLKLNELVEDGYLVPRLVGEDEERQQGGHSQQRWQTVRVQSESMKRGEVVPVQIRQHNGMINVGQLQKSGNLHGIGRKMNRWQIFEGQFVDNRLRGFGRVITGDGLYAIGYFQDDTLF